MRIKKFLAVLLVFALSFVGVGYAFDYLDQKSNKEAYGKSNTFEDNAIKTSENEYLILLVGVDKNSAEVENEDFTRTDTIMLLKADTKDGTIDLLSIPRDSRVKVRNTFEIGRAHV